MSLRDELSMTRRERVQRAIEVWHSNPDTVISDSLHEYLGWTWNEFSDWSLTGDLPPERDGAM